ncbi:MAG: zinc-ribbon domain-containing protein [Dehalococcoidales bacterium]|nr:zinc-ribbon domain-containing protein [Dehalococcoidales bacterium]
MTIFVGMLLTVISFAFIAYPLLKQKPRLADSADDENLLELQSRRDTTYSMLKELEFDYRSGILTEEDYHDLETKYKEKAVSILKDIDGSEAVDEEEDEIEKQVRKLRQSKAPPRTQPVMKAGKEKPAEAEIEQNVAKLRQQKRRFCPQCGAEHEADDRFCAHCGASLKRGDQN